MSGCWGGTGTKDPYAVIVGAVDVPAHAEVADLNYQSLTHQTVARGQVPVHEVQSRQVHHPRSDLAGHSQQLPQAQRAWSHVLPAGQQLGIRPVGPAKEGERRRGLGGENPQQPEERESGELGWSGVGDSGGWKRRKERAGEAAV